MTIKGTVFTSSSLTFISVFPAISNEELNFGAVNESLLVGNPA